MRRTVAVLVGCGLAVAIFAVVAVSLGNEGSVLEAVQRASDQGKPIEETRYAKSKYAYPSFQKPPTGDYSRRRATAGKQDTVGKKFDKLFDQYFNDPSKDLEPAYKAIAAKLNLKKPKKKNITVKGNPSPQTVEVIKELVPLKKAPALNQKHPPVVSVIGDQAYEVSKVIKVQKQTHAATTPKASRTVPSQQHLDQTQPTAKKEGNRSNQEEGTMMKIEGNIAPKAPTVVPLPTAIRKPPHVESPIDADHTTLLSGHGNTRRMDAKHLMPHISKPHVGRSVTVPPLGTTQGLPKGPLLHNHPLHTSATHTTRKPPTSRKPTAKHHGKEKKAHHKDKTLRNKDEDDGSKDEDKDEDGKKVEDDDDNEKVPTEGPWKDGNSNTGLEPPWKQNQNDGPSAVMAQLADDASGDETPPWVADTAPWEQDNVEAPEEEHASETKTTPKKTTASTNTKKTTASTNTKTADLQKDDFVQLAARKCAKRKVVQKKSCQKARASAAMDCTTVGHEQCVTAREAAKNHCATTKAATFKACFKDWRLAKKGVAPS